MDFCSVSEKAALSSLTAASIEIPTFFPIPDQKSFSFEKSLPDMQTIFAAPMTFSHNTVELKLSDDEINALEELYEPHFLSGVMAQNAPVARNIEQVWIKNGKYRK